MQGLRTRFHDTIRDITRQMVADAGLKSSTDDLSAYLGITPEGSAPRRPDMVVHGLGGQGGQPTLLDFTFSNPFCPSSLSRATSGRIAVARHSARLKIAKYAQAGYNPQAFPFIPLAGEFGGGLCDEWTAFIAALARHYTATPSFERSGLTPAEGEARFKRWWGQVLSCTTARHHFTFVRALLDSSDRHHLLFQQPWGACSAACLLY